MIMNNKIIMKSFLSHNTQFTCVQKANFYKWHSLDENRISDLLTLQNTGKRTEIQ